MFASTSIKVPMGVIMMIYLIVFVLLLTARTTDIHDTNITEYSMTIDKRKGGASYYISWTK